MIWWLVGYLPLPLCAHSDPWGDIHPVVAVIDGRFEVAFRCSLPDQPSSLIDEQPLQRMIFTRDGKLLAPRHAIDRTTMYRDHRPAGQNARRVQVGDEWLRFSIDSQGRPMFQSQDPSGHWSRVRLPWPEHFEMLRFEDVIATEEGVAITGKEDRTNLKFYWFAYESTADPEVRTIGPTACIYHFPVASNLVYAGERFWVAFMRPDEERGWKLSMWSWKLGEEEGRIEDLDSPADANSDLSLAAIGDRLCLAYHCLDYEAREPLARIVTVFRKAE